MTSLKSINRRVGSLFAVAALVLATVTPGLVPAFASAAQISERSVELSSSSKEATGVTYTVTFTPATDAKAVVVDVCNDTPLIEASCTAPTGFTVAGATTVGSFTRTTGGSNDANTAIYTGAISQPTPVELTVNNVTNPDNAGALYIRVVTYDGVDVPTAEAAATAYTSTNLGSGVADQGSAAVSITDSVGVSGAVLETMTFCVAGEAITVAGCVGADGLEAPTVKLGKTVGDVTALDALELSEGSIFSQLSTNAVSGAVVSLRSSAVDCGGLLRAGNTTPGECNIAPALNTGVAAGEAKFGVKTTAAVGVGSFTGVLQPASGSIYGAAAFALNYVDGDASGITGPYGDPFLDTAGAPVSNMGMEIIFGASIAPNTPAGLYSADLSLIATGKF